MHAKALDGKRLEFATTRTRGCVESPSRHAGRCGVFRNAGCRRLRRSRARRSAAFSSFKCGASAHSAHRCSSLRATSSNASRNGRHTRAAVTRRPAVPSLIDSVSTQYANSDENPSQRHSVESLVHVVAFQAAVAIAVDGVRNTFCPRYPAIHTLAALSEIAPARARPSHRGSRPSDTAAALAPRASRGRCRATGSPGPLGPSAPGGVTRRNSRPESISFGTLVVGARSILLLHAPVGDAVVHEVAAEKREPAAGVRFGCCDQLVLVGLDDLFFPRAL